MKMPRRLQMSYPPMGRLIVQCHPCESVYRPVLSALHLINPQAGHCLSMSPPITYLPESPRRRITLPHRRSILVNVGRTHPTALNVQSFRGYSSLGPSLLTVP